VPHLTLGRVRTGYNFDKLAATLAKFGDCILGQMRVDHAQENQCSEGVQ